MIVVDTNIIAYFYFSNPKSQLAVDLFIKDSDWQVPRLWRSEFRSVVSLYLRKKLLSFEVILKILAESEDLLNNNEHDLASMDIMPLVKASQCSAYDCEFVALAKVLNVPLVTEDKKIIQEFPDIAVSLERFLTH